MAKKPANPKAQTAPGEDVVTELPQPTNAEQGAAGHAPAPIPPVGLAHADQLADNSRILGIGNVPQVQASEGAIAAEPMPIVQNAADVIYSAPEIVHAGLPKDVGNAPLPDHGIDGRPTLDGKLARAAHGVVRAHRARQGHPDGGHWDDQTTDTRNAVQAIVAAAQRGELTEDSSEADLVRALVEAMK